MPIDENDFWPDLEANPAVTPPITILRAYAAPLNEKSGYKLRAEVKTDPSGETFVHRFNITVPELDYYTYELFQVQHTMNLYPVTCILNGRAVQLNTEVDLTKWLQQTLSSGDTKQVLSTLMAQVRS